MGDKQKTAKLLSYGLIVMAATHTFTHVFGGIHTAIFSLLRDEFSLSLQQLGLIAAIPPLCQALLAIPTGLLTDRIGSKKMLLLSFAFAAAGAILAGVARNPVMLVIAISLVYINTTIYHPASYSYTTKLFKPHDRSKALGLHGAGGTLGHAMGPLAVSLLVGVLAWQWRQVYLVLAVPMIIGIAMVLFIKEETPEEKKLNDEKPEEEGDSQKFLTASLVMFLVYSALRSMGGSMISSFLVLYLQDIRGMDIALASLISSATTLTGLMAAPIGGYMAARYGDKRWLQVALLAAFTLLALSFNVPGNTAFTALYVAYGFTNTLGMAPRSAIMAKLTPRRQRGLGYALFFLPGSIVGAIAPVVAGYLAGLIGFGNVFNIAIAINFTALAVLRFAVKVE
ncbi:MAG TPA: MFS transporter [Candidatus Krumholzibacteriaceae bacterium]|nr:MFS transporter [Candidatus Krumholzibacteriaceae bacterium]